jgi:peptide/nickel transport system substrate-binding protein
METTYRLQPNALWHDGTPVTSRDIAFSTRVQLDPQVEVNPIFAGTLRSYGAERVETPDDLTAIIHWSRPFGFADFLTFRDLSPLPTHLLESVYERDVEELSRHPYWSDDTVFVGNGPYRLARWEQGVMMDLQAFDRYYLGKPKIDRIVISFLQDNNAAVARVMTGDYDLAWGANFDRVTMDQVRERDIGDFVIGSEGVNHLAFQFKDVAQPIEISRDVRLRRALVHALDREAINEVDGDGLSVGADSWVHPNDPRYKDTEPFIMKYPHDPQRALALLAEAGWTRGSDGLLRHADGRAFACDIRARQNAKAGEIASAAWRTIGVTTAAQPLPANLARDLEARATYPCVEDSFRSFGRSGVQHLHSAQAMIPERRYVGTNRGAFMSAEMDRLIDGFFLTPRSADRLQLDREMVQLISTELPIIHTIYDIRKEFQAAGFTGMGIKTGLDPIRSSTWNVHEWDKR